MTWYGIIKSKVNNRKLSAFFSDVDECTKPEVHQCEQVCNNTPGRLACSVLSHKREQHLSLPH